MRTLTADRAGYLFIPPATTGLLLGGLHYFYPDLLLDRKTIIAQVCGDFAIRVVDTAVYLLETKEDDNAFEERSKGVALEALAKKATEMAVVGIAVGYADGNWDKKETITSLVGTLMITGLDYLTTLVPEPSGQARVIPVVVK
jgi:hypothetical protein